MLLWSITGEKWNGNDYWLIYVSEIWGINDSIKKITSNMGNLCMKTFSCCLPEKTCRSSELQEQPWKLRKATIETLVADLTAATI